MYSHCIGNTNKKNKKTNFEGCQSNSMSNYSPPVFNDAEMQRLIFFWYSIMSSLAVTGLVCVGCLVWYYFVRFVPLKDQARDAELTGWMPKMAGTCFIVTICVITALTRSLEARGIPWQEGAKMLF
jgi:hypothetical protein